MVEEKLQVSVVCGIESLAREYRKILELMGFRVCSKASTRLLIDVPAGWVAMFLQSTAEPVQGTVIVSNNPCPEYTLYLLTFSPAVLVSKHNFIDVLTVLEAVRDGKRVQPQIATTLTGSERNTLRLIAEGYPLKTVAEQRDVSEGTLRNTVSEIYGKLGLRSHAQLTLYYYGHWHTLIRIHDWKPEAHLVGRAFDQDT